MHNKFMKKFLRTTAVASIVLFGAKNSHAASLLLDEGGTDVANLTKTMSSKFASLVPGGTLNPVGTSLVMTHPKSEAYVSSTTGAAITLTALTATKDSHLHLLGSADTTIGAATAPSSGSAFIHLKKASVTVPQDLTSAFKLIAEYPVGANGVTLTGLAPGNFVPDIEAISPVTFAALTSLSGKISGKGNITLGTVTAITGNTSTYTGNFVTGASLTDVALPSSGGIEVAGAHDITLTTATPSTLGRLYINGNCTFTPVANVTIKELYLPTAGATVTLVPPANVLITIQRIMVGSDGGIILNGDAAGRLKIISGETSGAVAVTAGVLE